MRIIAHRGNLGGPTTDVGYLARVFDALRKGYEAEIDIWGMGDGQLWVGHNAPVEPVIPSDIEGKPLWCHAKNRIALDILMDLNLHCFWHERDSYTLTSQGYVWVFPGEFPPKRSIVVVRDHPQSFDFLKLPNWVEGICTD